jgi:hypothetical protein
LAYSSSEEKAKNIVNGVLPTDEELTKETSPDKTVNIRQDISNLDGLQNLNEDTLTEIPLNTNENLQVKCQLLNTFLCLPTVYD